MNKYLVSADQLYDSLFDCQLCDQFHPEYLFYIKFQNMNENGNVKKCANLP